MLDTEAAWLAGYIDGDGSISLYAKSGRKFRHPILIIDSTDPELLDEVERLLGGTRTKKTKTQDHHRQCYSWRLYGANNILEALKHIQPYLRCSVKKRRALMLLDDWKNVTSPNGRYCETQLKAKLEFERQFMLLGQGRGSRIKL